jgi:hypothetical protein
MDVSASNHYGTKMPKWEKGSPAFRSCFDSRTHAFRHSKLMPFPVKNPQLLAMLSGDAW